MVRRLSGMTLDTFCRRHIFEPLGLESFRFSPDWKKLNIIPTAYCPIRNRWLHGEVHDENAALFDGEGGNAGLFGTASDIHRYCLMLLNGGNLEGQKVLSERMIEIQFQNQNSATLTPRTFGWDWNPESADYKSCGDRMPTGSIGHLGFTGTSLWLDRQSQIIVIILTNRLRISREGNLEQMRAFRPMIHDKLLSLIL